MSEMNVEKGPYTVVLGIAQDGGVPHAGTGSDAWDDLRRRRHAACLGIVDPRDGQRWMIEATPDFKEQLYRLERAAPRQRESEPFLSGIALTHAHIGHYLGLAFLGKEILNTGNLPLYVMPQMKEFLLNNLPWKALVNNGNILLHELQPDVPRQLNERLRLTPIPVPHRDEHSETVGFRIEGPKRSVLFVPDIDRWEDLNAWGRSIEEEIAKVDVAFLDGTFFDANELPGRDMRMIPHPTIRASMERFAGLPPEVRSRTRFIHLNHSNPALDPGSVERRMIEDAGFSVAVEGEIIGL